MGKNRLHKSQRGQGMIEYGIVIILVAFVVIVAAAATGIVVKRLYGLVAGATGSKTITSAGAIEINDAYCQVGPGMTGLAVRGITNENFADLIVVTNNATNGMAPLGQIVVHSDTASVDPAHIFLVNSTLANVADPKYCPQSVVIQAKDGAQAQWPVEVFYP